MGKLKKAIKKRKKSLLLLTLLPTCFLPPPLLSLVAFRLDMPKGIYIIGVPSPDGGLVSRYIICTRPRDYTIWDEDAAAGVSSFTNIPKSRSSQSICISYSKLNPPPQATAHSDPRTRSFTVLLFLLF